MNERIIALMNQANKDAGFTFSMDQAKPVHELMGKFAELIVRECAKSADEWYQNHNDIHWDPAQHIKNHFGVE